MADPKTQVKVKAKSKTTVKALPKVAGSRPSRIAKQTKKLARMKAVGLRGDRIAYAVRVVILNAPCEIAGVIISMDENSLVLHCQKHGSSKELVRMIPRNDLIEIIGGVGTPSLVRYFGQQVLTEIKSAQVKSSNGVFNITDMITGDVSTVIASDRISVEIVGTAENLLGEPKAKTASKKFKS